MEPNFQNNIQAVEKEDKALQKQQFQIDEAVYTDKTPQFVHSGAVSNRDQNNQINSDQVKIEMQEQSQSENEDVNGTEMMDQQNSNSISQSTRKGINQSGQKPHREQKYKRSTNNSHKKFISVARRWMFKNNRSQLKGEFQKTFHGYKSTRTYFFIILGFIKNAMSQGKKEQFKVHFMKEIQEKIKQYQKQIEATPNQNLKHFRGDEITDLKFAIKAFTSYFQGDNQKAIECVYKKDKATIVKKQHYDQALKTLNRVQIQFSEPSYVAKTIATQQNDTGKRKPRVRKPKIKQLKLQQNIQKLTQSQNIFYTPQMFGLKKDFISLRKRVQKTFKLAQKKVQQSHQQQKKQNQNVVKLQQNHQQSRLVSLKKQRFSPILLWNDYYSLNIGVQSELISKERVQNSIKIEHIQENNDSQKLATPSDNVLLQKKVEENEEDKTAQQNQKIQQKEEQNKLEGLKDQDEKVQELQNNN